VASGAPSDDAGTLHVHMCVGEAPRCAAVRTLSFSSCKVHGEYFAQFTSEHGKKSVAARAAFAMSLWHHMETAGRHPLDTSPRDPTS
jgi:hypothetical protein